MANNYFASLNWMVMKSETVFALENAGWPALLVDASGAIRAASLGAKRLFGSVIESRPTLAQSVWSKENDLPPEQFLSQWQDKSQGEVELRFRGRDGSTCSYETRVCQMSHDGEELFFAAVVQIDAAGGSA